jgi:hypothetical protein
VNYEIFNFLFVPRHRVTSASRPAAVLDLEYQNGKVIIKDLELGEEKWASPADVGLLSRSGAGCF